jgi:methylenetetrahydrofolate reductase (NADPH)
VDKKKQGDEGIKIAIEQMQEVKEIKGIAGIHVMAIEWEERVEELVTGAGLLPRPQVA